MILIELQNIKAQQFQDWNGKHILLDGITAERARQGLAIRTKLPKLGKGKDTMLKKQYYRIKRQFKSEKLLTIFN